MEFGPIVRALFKNRTRFVLIALEVGLALAVVVNCVHLLTEIRQTVTKPSGLRDEGSLLAVRIEAFDPSLNDAETAENLRQADIRRLRSLPGVQAATRTGVVPLSGSGNSSGIRLKSDDIESTPGPEFEVSEGWLETFGVEISKGQNLAAEDFQEGSRRVLLTEALAQRLFPDQDPIGRQFYMFGDDPLTVIGLVKHMTNAWPQSEFADLGVFHGGLPSAPGFHYYLVRATPGLVDEVKKAIEPALLADHTGRTVEVTAMTEVRAKTFSQIQLASRLLTGVIFLLVFVTALGIAGVTSFSVTQRTRQIGTRRALGASRGEILRYFLLENWLVTSLGLVIGVILAYVLNDSLARFAAASRLPAGLLVVGMGFFWLLGLATAFLPALRATRVPPVVATRAV